MGWRWVCAMVLLGCAVQARADYAAGRLSAVDGTVYVQTPGDTDSHQATANEVLAEGDQVATWDASGAELQFADAVLQLAPDTVVALTRVDTDQVSVYVAQGSVAAARLPRSHPARLALQGPHIIGWLAGAGRFRLSVWPGNQQEWLSVRQGRVDAEADQNTLTLYAGQGLQAFQAAGGEATSITAAESEDSLDYALLESDEHLRRAAVLAHLGGDWIGAAALDDQGQWMEVSSVGPLWVPMFLPSGWAPYRAGHWQWNAVWGWTWIDDLPWCWMPYHYGRWIWWNNRWAWSPQGRRPLFSPAAPPPAGVALPPLPAPWHPQGRVALAGRAATQLRAQPAAPPDIAPLHTVTPMSPGGRGASAPHPAALAAPTLPGPANAVPAVPQIRVQRRAPAEAPEGMEHGWEHPAAHAVERAPEPRGPDLRGAEPAPHPPHGPHGQAGTPAGGAPSGIVPATGPAAGPAARASGPGAPVSGAGRRPGAAPGSPPNASEGASRKPERRS